MPRVARTEMMEQPVAQGKPRTMKSSGPAAQSLEPATYPQADRAAEIVVSRQVRIDDEKTAKLAFDQEMIEVMIHTTTDPVAPQTFELGVNGHMVILQRGKTYTLKRYLVEKLMRCKETTYRQEEATGPDGERQYKYIPQDALRFGFTITRDANPRSADWQRAIAAEPN